MNRPVPDVVRPAHLYRPALLESPAKVAAPAEQIHATELSDRRCRVKALPQRSREIAVVRYTLLATILLPLQAMGDIEQAPRAAPVVRRGYRLPRPEEANSAFADNPVRFDHGKLIRVHQLVRGRACSGVNLAPTQQFPKPHKHVLALPKDLDNFVRISGILGTGNEHGIAGFETELLPAV